MRINVGYDQKKCLRDPEIIGERKNKDLPKGGVKDMQAILEMLPA